MTFGIKFKNLQQIKALGRYKYVNNILCETQHCFVFKFKSHNCFNIYFQNILMRFKCCRICYVATLKTYLTQKHFEQALIIMLLRNNFYFDQYLLFLVQLPVYPNVFSKYLGIKYLFDFSQKVITIFKSTK